MAARLNPNVLYVQEPSLQDSNRLSAADVGEDSSDSDGEQEGASHKLIRKVSTSGQIRAKYLVILCPDDYRSQLQLCFDDHDLRSSFI